MEVAKDASPLEARPLARRWLMLACFCLVTLANGFQWIQFAIISEAVSSYYDVSTEAVQWTSLVFMALYIPGIFPASWLLDQKGLRWTLTLAALGNCLAAWIKVVAVRQDLFGVLFVGQTVAAMMQAFVLSVPPRLAALWFGADQLATATAIGVFGNQVGNALGFVVPSVMVRSPQAGVSHEDVGLDMLCLGYIVAGVTTATLLLVFFVFQTAPPIPPSQAQAAVRIQSEPVTLSAFMESLKFLMTCAGFVQLLVAYGVSNGVTLAAATVLNQLILALFPDSTEDAGFIGLCMVVAGLISAILYGIILDRTGKFKLLFVVVFVVALIAVATFTAALFFRHMVSVYLTGTLAGFALTGAIPVGFEFAAELTYPASEATSSGLLSAAGQFMGIVITLLCGWLMELEQGWMWACVSMTVVIAVATMVAVTIPQNLRRHDHAVGTRAY